MTNTNNTNNENNKNSIQYPQGLLTLSLTAIFLLILLPNLTELVEAGNFGIRFYITAGATVLYFVDLIATAISFFKNRKNKETDK